MTATAATPRTVLPRTVLIIMPLADLTGGSQRKLRDFARQFDRSRLELVVAFLTDGPLVEQVRDTGVRAVVVEAGRLRQVGRFTATVSRLARLTTEAGADLVMSWMGKAHLYASPAALLAGRPSLMCQQELPHRTPKHWLESHLPGLGVVANARHVADAQRRLNPKRPVWYAYPGVDLELFDPSLQPSPTEVRRTLGLSADRRLIGMFGRLDRWKCAHVFVNAFARVAAKHADVDGLIVGAPHDLDPGYAREVTGMIGKLGLAERLRMVGYQPNPASWMQAVDIMTHPADHEPFGQVIVQGMALGKPVVATRSGGPAEIIADGQDGLLVPVNDPESLAAALDRVLDDAALAKALGEAATRRARDFSVARFCAELTEIVSTIALPATRSETAWVGIGDEAKREV
jgi:glycosyltransferase involved in cell wall biosynthesis